MERFSEALDELAKVGVADRGLPFYETRRGIYLRINELQKAAQDFEQIVRLDSEESSLHYLKAASLVVAAGDFKAYRQLCRDALDRFAT